MNKDGTPSKLCDIRTKPREFTNCTNYSCPKWDSTRWGDCSATCGMGTRRRSAFCKLSDGTITTDSDCDPELRPNEVESCEKPSCPTWRAGVWSACNRDNCEKLRTVTCLHGNGSIVNEQLCNQTNRPSQTTACSASECYPKQTAPKVASLQSVSLAVRVHHTKWSRCTSHCKDIIGMKNRTAICRLESNGTEVPIQYCNVTSSIQRVYCITNASCTYKLNEEWSSCSADCGSIGVQKTQLVCREAVTQRTFNLTNCGMIANIQNSTFNSTVRKCTKSCNATHFEWRYTSWSTVSYLNSFHF